MVYWGLILMLLSGTLSTSDKEKIAYDYYKNNHSKAIIIAHGFYNSKDSVLLKKLAKNLSDEYDVFMFDFRGHGQSSGLFSWLTNEEKDLEAVLDYLDGKYEKIGLVAFSLGGSVSINTLAQREGVDSLVCVSVPSELEKIDYKLLELSWEDDVVYTMFNKEGKKGKGVRPGPFWLKKKKPIKQVGKIKIPILYIHGDKDWVIKLWHSEVLYEETNSKKKLIIIEGGPHAEYLMKDFSKEFTEEVKKWFEETLNKGEK